MSLPKLKNLTITAHGLHRSAVLLGAVQRLTQAPRPAYLELGLEVLPQGFSTGPLPAGGRVLLDLSAGCLAYTSRDGSKATLPIAGRSQSALFTDLFELLAAGELARVLPPGVDLFERVSQGIAARGGRYRSPSREKLLDETPIQVDAQAAGDYLQIIQAIFTGIARFLARLSESKTPLVVWPEGFDLSTLLFTGMEIDEKLPHMNFGFAPFASGMEYPYLYAYVYPAPDRFEPSRLPEGARWNTQNWIGVLMDYQRIADAADACGYVDASCMSIYQALRPLLNG
jgi:hypothetical protein